MALTARQSRAVPVGQRPYEGVGEQLHSGLGSKQHPNFDIFIKQPAGGPRAVGGVAWKRCVGWGGAGRVSCADGGVGAR